METKMKKSFSDKAFSLKGKASTKSDWFLISVIVFGSAGTIRFVVNGDDDAAAVTDTALNIYARQGRLPVLGSDIHSFYLYPAHADFREMKGREKIGWGGARSFILSKREKKPHMTEARSEVISRKGRGWRAWLQKLVTLKI